MFWSWLSTVIVIFFPSQVRFYVCCTVKCDCKQKSVLMCCHCVNGPQHFADHQHIPAICFLFSYNIDATGTYKCKNPTPNPHINDRIACWGVELCFYTLNLGNHLHDCVFLLLLNEILALLDVLLLNQAYYSCISIYFQC